MKLLATSSLILLLSASGAYAQVNGGEQKPEATVPFELAQVATFNLPWRIAFLPDGRMLITEKVGPVWLVTQTGEKTPVANAPAVLSQGQGGMLGIYVSPTYAKDRSVYLTYSEPATPANGTSSLALAKATLTIANGAASLDGLQVIWRDPAKGRGGQFGAAVAFSADGRYLYLSVGDRQRMTPAQDPGLPARQDSPAHARRQARSGQPQRGQDRRGHTQRHQSTARHRAGQDGPGRQHVHLHRAEPHAVGNVGDRIPHAVRPLLHAGWSPLGTRTRAPWRRRAESRGAGQELRLAAGGLLHQLQRRRDSPSGHAP